MALYREDLDPMPASFPTQGGPSQGGEDLWFHARCHLDSPTWARYRDGVLTIQCARCERDVVAVVVAARGGPSRPVP